MPPTMERCEIAVILPCRNEDAAIARAGRSEQGPTLLPAEASARARLAPVVD